MFAFATEFQYLHDSDTARISGATKNLMIKVMISSTDTKGVSSRLAEVENVSISEQLRFDMFFVCGCKKYEPRTRGFLFGKKGNSACVYLMNCDGMKLCLSVEQRMEQHRLDTTECNASKIARECPEEEGTWAHIVFALTALELVAVSQVCKTLRKVVMDNLLAWCFDIDVHPNSQISRNFELGTRACLYQLYELYRRNMISDGTYTAAKARFFTDEELAGKCSFLFIVPSKRKPTKVELDLIQSTVTIGTVKTLPQNIDTVYGMHITFQDKLLLRLSVGSIILEDFWQNADYVKTAFHVVAHLETVIFCYTMSFVSAELACDIIQKSTSCRHISILDLFGHGCSLDCIKRLFSRTLTRTPLRIWENANVIFNILSHMNGDDAHVEFWLDYLLDNKFGAIRLAEIFFDYCKDDVASRFPVLRKRLHAIPEFSKSLYKLVVPRNVHELKLWESEYASM